MKAQTGVNPQHVQRSLALLVESPRLVYLAGVGLGIGCGGLVVALLLGVLSLG
jgi:hypothetical protein